MMILYLNNSCSLLWPIGALSLTREDQVLCLWLVALPSELLGCFSLESSLCFSSEGGMVWVEPSMAVVQEDHQ